MEVRTWESCYRDSWNGLIVPEAFSHPAKVSPGLAKRIFEHGFQQGWWKKGDVCGDPFGGIGGFGIWAASMGLQWVGVELEERFVDLARQNFALHANRWDALGCPQPVIIQGDSRRFSDLVGEVAGICTSPPFMDSLAHKEDDGTFAANGFNENGTRRGGSLVGTSYGSTPGQIGAMKPGKLDSVITSPPYAETQLTEKRNFQSRFQMERPGASGITSDQYGSNPANIGNLRAGKLDGICTSPPYNKPFSQDHNGKRGGKRAIGEAPSSVPGAFTIYGTSEGQIEGVTPDTYWQAMAEVYRECHKALKPGGMLVVVIKMYVKKGKLIHLPMQTLKLLIKLGFQPIERIKAMLVEETSTPILFGKDIVKTKARKSFFRRLAESKGSPAIDWEEVLVVQKGGA